MNEITDRGKVMRVFLPVQCLTESTSLMLGSSDPSCYCITSLVSPLCRSVLLELGTNDSNISSNKYSHNDNKDKKDAVTEEVRIVGLWINSSGSDESSLTDTSLNWLRVLGDEVKQMIVVQWTGTRLIVLPLSDWFSVTHSLSRDELGQQCTVADPTTLTASIPQQDEMQELQAQVTQHVDDWQHLNQVQLQPDEHLQPLLFLQRLDNQEKQQRLHNQQLGNLNKLLHLIPSKLIRTSNQQQSEKELLHLELSDQQVQQPLPHRIGDLQVQSQDWFLKEHKLVQSQQLDNQNEQSVLLPQEIGDQQKTTAPQKLNNEKDQEHIILQQAQEKQWLVFPHELGDRSEQPLNQKFVDKQIQQQAHSQPQGEQVQPSAAEQQVKPESGTSVIEHQSISNGMRYVLVLVDLLELTNSPFFSLTSVINNSNSTMSSNSDSAVEDLSIVGILERSMRRQLSAVRGSGKVLFRYEGEQDVNKVNHRTELLEQSSQKQCQQCGHPVKCQHQCYQAKSQQDKQCHQQHVSQLTRSRQKTGHVLDMTGCGERRESRRGVRGWCELLLMIIVYPLVWISQARLFQSSTVCQVLFTPAVTSQLRRKFLSVADRLSFLRPSSAAPTPPHAHPSSTASTPPHTYPTSDNGCDSNRDRCGCSEGESSGGKSSEGSSSSAHMKGGETNISPCGNNRSPTNQLCRILLMDTVCTQLLDSVLGLLFVLFVLRFAVNSRFISASDLIDYAQMVAGRCEELIHWLMGAPAGLKLNEPLTRFLAQFFLCHIYLWTNYLEAVRSYWTELFQLLFLSPWVGLLGLTVILTTAQDLLSIITLHIYCFYVYAARLYQVHVYTVSSLWRLFLGRKWNVLRKRVDTLEQLNVLQLYVGTLLLTILVFLLPTTALYYTVFSLLRLVVLLIHSVISLFISVIHHSSLYLSLLRILNSSSLQAELCISLLSPGQLLQQQQQQEFPAGIEQAFSTQDHRTECLQLTTKPISYSQLFRLAKMSTNQLLAVTCNANACSASDTDSDITSCGHSRSGNASSSCSSSSGSAGNSCSRMIRSSESSSRSKYSWTCLMKKLIVGELIYPWIEVKPS